MTNDLDTLADSERGTTMPSPTHTTSSEWLAIAATDAADSVRAGADRALAAPGKLSAEWWIALAELAVGEALAEVLGERS